VRSHYPQRRNLSREKETAQQFLPRERCKYIAFFKPFAVLSQFGKESAGNKRTLADFAFPKEVYPVGRLDNDSEGLLLLSDDGRLNSLLLPPERAHRRSYFVQVEGIPDREALEKLSEGVIIDGHKTRSAVVRLLESEPDLPEREVPIRFRKNIPTAWLELTLVEGKNRQVRRMTASVGHPTLRLLRFAIGALTIEQLKLASGEWQLLAESELNRCFQ
jgi:23S rRNA pseudouridine2457 synthase